MKGIFIREQASALKSAGLPVAVFYPFDEEIASGNMEKRVEQGIDVYRANTLGFQNRYLARFASYYTGVKKLQDVVGSFQPDLIHVHVAYPAGIIANLFSRRTRIPYVITEHMSYLKDYVDKWQHRVLLKPSFEQAALVLPVSSALAEKIRDFGWKVNMQSVPNVVDTDRFTALHTDKQKDDSCVNLRDLDDTSMCRAGSLGQIDVLFAGNMEETQVKGLQYLLPAFAQVLDACPDKKLHLHLVGDGSKRQDYEKMTKDLKINDQCTFYGRIHPERMPEFYRKSDLLVVSSLKETFGCVLIEAMACGKPVLATACGGPQEIVKDTVGVLVEPGSTEELVQGLKKAIESLHSYDPEEIRRYAVENYSPQALANTLKKIYSEIISAE
jgi:glycosyltransferase involved in cell wall biosynthesis